MNIPKNLNSPIIPNGNFTWAEATKGGQRMPPNEEIYQGIIRIATALEGAREKLGGWRARWGI